MIAGWMVYSVVVAALLGLAAWGAERVLLAFERPTRIAWMASLAGVVFAPLVAASWHAESRGAEPRASVVVGDVVEVADVGLLEPIGGWIRFADIPGLPDLSRLEAARAWDRPLLAAWLTGSLIVLLLLHGSHAALRRQRSSWRRAVIDGMPVWVSTGLGPAVVGFTRGQIVLPEWAMRIDPEDRQLLLRHETEHVRARDPWLCLWGFTMLVLLPWNPAVWWQVRRLRGAIEIDCDARVLGRSGDIGRYGMLLLEVARRAMSSRLATAGFLGRSTQLERRVRVMTAPRRRREWLRAFPAGVAAFSLSVIACLLETPTWTRTEPLGAQMPPIVARGLGDTGQEGIPSDSDRRRTVAVPEPDIPKEFSRERLPSTPYAGDPLERTSGAGADYVPLTREPRPSLSPGGLTQASGYGASDLSGPGDDDGGRPPAASGEVRPALANRAEVVQQLEERYPTELKAAGIGGTAVLRAFIDSEGRVRRTRIESASGNARLDAIAASVIREVARFQPARSGDSTIPVWVAMPVTFVSVAGETSSSPGAFAARSELSIPRNRTAHRAPPSLTPIRLVPKLRNREAFVRALERRYPPMLREAGIGGTTLLLIQVDANGMVTQTHVHRSSGFDQLDRTAETVMREVARFTPAITHGYDEPVWVQVPVSFVSEFGPIAWSRGS